MVRLVIDDSISQLLHQQTEPVDLFDKQGRSLGRFVPHRDSETSQSDEASSSPNDEDIRIAKERLAGDGVWHSAADAISHLESMDASQRGAVLH